jgi:hypothetical protein
MFDLGLTALGLLSMKLASSVPQLETVLTRIPADGAPISSYQATMIRSGAFLAVALAIVLCATPVSALSMCCC